jgi:UDP-N-acetylglucosamine--N-acetylmuramyl-(pentapeptide) pyrophosphoryl-undecaprenol N-acetylglucosamine transferase
VAARILGKKIFVHESDLVPGLANRICAKLANKVLVSFPESVRFFKDQNKVVVTGNPVRCSICNGSKSKGYALTKFQKDLPTILVMGGSQGAQQINKLVRKNLKKILPIAQIIHICGEQKKGLALDGLGLSNYVQYEFVKDELPHLYAIADIVVSRAGANSLSEIIALKKPAILIPLSTQSSRGDQIQNAKLFKKHKLGFVLENNEANAENFFSKIEELIKTPKLLQEIQMNFEKLTQTDASVEIVKLIKKEFGI